MFNLHKFVLCLLFLGEAPAVAPFTHYFTDFYLESVTGLYTKSVYCDGNATLKRSGRGQHPKISIEVDIHDSIRKYDHDVKTYYSPLGNRRYILMPFKVVRHPICDGFKSKFIQQEIRNLQNYSNLPLPSNQIPYCDLLGVGHYYVKDYMIDKSVFPSIIRPGRYRLVASIFRKTTGEIVQAIEFIATFT